MRRFCGAARAAPLATRAFPLRAVTGRALSTMPAKPVRLDPQLESVLARFKKGGSNEKEGAARLVEDFERLQHSVQQLGNAIITASRKQSGLQIGLAPRGKVEDDFFYEDWVPTHLDAVRHSDDYHLKLLGRDTVDKRCLAFELSSGGLYDAT